jgi:hypothetical protein
MEWGNILSGTGDFLKNNMGTIASLAGAGASIYGGLQASKMAKIAQGELDLGRDSYYRNVLRQNQEDDAINSAGASIKI